MNDHLNETVAGLSARGEARREEILADLIARAPEIRRARRVRRSAIAGVVAAVPVVVVAGVVVMGEREMRGPAESGVIAGSGAGEVIAASPDPVEASGPGTASAPDWTRGVIVSVVSTASRSYESQIAGTPTSRVELIDDDALLLLLEKEGKRDGLVRVAGKVMLASEIASGAADDAVPGQPHGMGDVLEVIGPGRVGPSGRG